MQQIQVWFQKMNTIEKLSNGYNKCVNFRGPVTVSLCSCCLCKMSIIRTNISVSLRGNKLLHESYKVGRLPVTSTVMIQTQILKFHIYIYIYIHYSLHLTSPCSDCYSLFVFGKSQAQICFKFY
jgi:hypothetical protein